MYNQEETTRDSKELIRQAREYRILFENAPAMLGIVDKQGVYLDVNKEVINLLGYTREELIGKDCFRLVHPDDIEDVLLKFSEMIKTDHGKVVYRFLHKNGSYRFLQSKAVRIDKTDTFFIYSDDITEKLEKEKTIQQNVESLNQAEQIANLGYFERNWQTGEGFWSKGLHNLMGIIPGEVECSNDVFMGFVHPDDRDRVALHIRDSLTEHTEMNVRFRLVQKNGNVLEIHGIGKSYFDSQGNPINTIGTFQDITNRKVDERIRERLSQAIEQVGEAIVVTDVRGDIEYINPAFQKHTGFTRDEVVGKNPRLLKSNVHDVEFYRKMWQKLLNHETWTGRLINKKKDGTFFTEEAVISPVHDDAGKIVNYIAVKRNITEKLALEEKLRQALKMEAVGRLAGGVAHDFNNMLSIIIGHTEMILEDSDSSQSIHGDLLEIRKAASRSADLTRQLLAFARKQTIDPKVIDLNTTVDKMVRMLKRLIGEDIELNWCPGADVWPVKIDPVQIDQVLVNLCVNARDAISDIGQVIIETENVTLDKDFCSSLPGFVPGEYVMLAVSDNGCGMDQKTVDSAFEPFFTTKEAGKGTGLGLATVYGIVKQNKGFIDIYSQVNIGTFVKIYLVPHEKKSECDSLNQDVNLETDNCSETILLVEDEPAILKLTSRILKKDGYKVLSAGTPSEAMKIAADFTEEIDLLMSDVVMPDMNGRDLARKICQLYPKMKCLFMSGYTSDIIAPHGVLDPGVSFISKPFSMKDLSLKIRETLDQE